MRWWLFLLAPTFYLLGQLIFASLMVLITLVTKVVWQNSYLDRTDDDT